MMRRDRRPPGERGQVIPMVAVVLVVLIAFAALTIDLGYLRMRRRDMQAVGDVISLDLVRRLDGRTAAALMTDPAWTATFSGTIAESRDDNNHPSDGDHLLDVELGTVDDERTFTSVAFYMIDNVVQPPSTDGSTVITAVRVTTQTTVDYFFRPGTGDTSRSAVATSDATARFEVGSFLASVSPFQQGLFNQLFARFGLNGLGANALAYSGVANGQLAIGNLAASMDALYPNGGADTTLTRREFLLLAADAAQRGGDTASATALQNAANAPTAQATLNAPTTLTLGEIADAYLQGSDSFGAATVELPGFIATGLLLMDGTNTVSVPASTFSFPGLGQVDVELHVINPPAWAAGRVGVSATNTQLELRIRPRFTFSDSAGFDLETCLALDAGLLGLVGGLSTCLTAGLRVVGVDLDVTSEIIVRAARARGTLSAIDCDATPGITVTPDILEAASLTTAVDARLNVRLLGSTFPDAVNLHINPTSIGTTGSAPPERFDDPTQFDVTRRVGANPLGLATLVNFGTASIQVLGAPLPAANLIVPRAQSLIANRLAPALQQIDALLTGPLTNMLGLHLGGADLTATHRNCEGVRLVG